MKESIVRPGVVGRLEFYLKKKVSQSAGNLNCKTNEKLLTLGKCFIHLKLVHVTQSHGKDFHKSKMEIAIYKSIWKTFWVKHISSKATKVPHLI